MDEDPEIVVVRMGHRPGRDERMTTHVGLTARALGADKAVIADATQSVETVRDITDRFGGPFEVSETSDPLGVIEQWDGAIVHLTMYGLPVQDVEDEIRTRHDDGESLLVVVGAEKVPFDVYEQADYNVGVTNQPHSEVASLAVFLDHLFEGEELDQEWTDADSVVVPKETGKRVEDQ